MGTTRPFAQTRLSAWLKKRVSAVDKSSNSVNDFCRTRESGDSHIKVFRTADRRKVCMFMNIYAIAQMLCIGPSKVTSVRRRPRSSYSEAGYTNRLIESESHKGLT